MCLLGIAAWVHLYHPFFKSLGLSAGSDRMFTPANSFTSANASVRMTPALVSGRGARRPSSQGKAADVAKQKESPCEDWAEKHQHAEYTSEGTRSMLAGEEEVVHSAGNSRGDVCEKWYEDVSFEGHPPTANQLADFKPKSVSAVAKAAAVYVKKLADQVDADVEQPKKQHKARHTGPKRSDQARSKAVASDAQSDAQSDRDDAEDSEDSDI